MFGYNSPMQVAELDTQKVEFYLFELIEAELRLVETRMRQMTVQAHHSLVEAVHQVLDSGGKRVRPSITLLAGAALGAERLKLIDLASAVELLHTATLVHDDIIDGALLRRGEQTLNATWSPGATILTGDFIFARAAQLAAATHNVPVISLFAETLMVICNGELHQLFDGRAGEREREAYYARIYAKTGSLFALASEAAALLATTNAEVIAGMRRFGSKLGMAFQVVDDVLDFVGKENRVGKPLGSDLRHGLVTLPTIYFLENSSQTTQVEAILNGQRTNKQMMNEVINAIGKSDAIELAMGEAKAFADEAKESLSLLPASSRRDALADLADYVVGRTV